MVRASVAVLIVLVVGCSTGSDGGSDVDPAPVFVSDASLLAGIDPEVTPVESLDWGEFTMLRSDDGALVSVEVAVRDRDGQPMDFAVENASESLADGTPVDVVEPDDPESVRRITYAADSGAAVTLLSFDLPLDELLAIGDGLDVSDDGSVTEDLDGIEVTARARQPFYTGGQRTAYAFDGGESGEVTIGSYAIRGDELAVFDFGPHDPARVGSRDVLYNDQGSGNGSYVFEWDDETLIEVVVSLGPGVATTDEIVELIDGVRPDEA